MSEYFHILIANNNDWIGALVLFFLELILGIDNILFIALVLQRVSKKYREKVRVIGLILALIARIIVLMLIVEVVQFTHPVFQIGKIAFSMKNIIFLFGGVFLISKAINEFYQYFTNQKKLINNKKHIVFSVWLIGIFQIIVVDLIFAFDSLVTAVCITNKVQIMIFAIVGSAICMLFMSRFVSILLDKKPVMIIFILGLVLIIGIFLMLEGFSIKLSKIYFYITILIFCIITCFYQWIYEKKSKHDSYEF